MDKILKPANGLGNFDDGGSSVAYNLVTNWLLILSYQRQGVELRLLVAEPRSR